eukprot:CAMPEP_0169301672 /NCGR_PEP_ID=MMETSP1016-20121227/68386_1 /TAXON_ID=342587 /ORGANISM="Karlodinium micrum, Strain CCMP2283" /LENGTH=115 /DNA_ID=CAMNT_0009394321 /DNA_START=68 /DNA_END=415 /DNA_ORIENTATION=+
MAHLLPPGGELTEEDRANIQRDCIELPRAREGKKPLEDGGGAITEAEKRCMDKAEKQAKKDYWKKHSEKQDGAEPEESNKPKQPKPGESAGDSMYRLSSFITLCLLVSVLMQSHC